MLGRARWICAHPYGKPGSNWTVMPVWTNFTEEHNPKQSGSSKPPKPPPPSEEPNADQWNKTPIYDLLISFIFPNNVTNIKILITTQPINVSSLRLPTKKRDSILIRSDRFRPTSSTQLHHNLIFQFCILQRSLLGRLCHSSSLQLI